MQYEPIKNFLNKIFRTPALRKVFYRLIDILLLRTWHIHKEIKKWLKTAPPEPSVYDAGSGLGQHSYFIARKCKNCKILGIDVNEEQVKASNDFFKKIKLDNRVKFQQGKLEDFYCEQCFDLIINIEVIEHIEDDQKVLENFARSLKKGGTLILTTPALSAGHNDHHDHHHHSHDSSSSFVDEHVRDGYEPEDLKQKLLKAGFSDVQIKFMYGKFGAFAWRLSMKYPIIMLNKSMAFFVILPFYYLLVMPFVLVLDWLDTIVKNPRGSSLLVIAKK